MRKFVLLLVPLLAYLSPLALHASGEVYSQWDGSTVTEVVPSGDLYTVTNAAELAWIASQDDAFAGKTIVLNAHIDLNGKTWTPIGSAARPFAGTFKGKGHLIKGFSMINGTDGIGLFGHVGATGVIDSLGISGGAIVADGVRRVGSIAGVCAGAINQCWNMSEIAVNGTVVGGLVGDLTSTGTITDCYQTGLIFGPADTIGGLVGRNAGRVTRAYNAGYVNKGNAIFGLNLRNEKFTDCYFDRKLYYQPAGVLGDTVTAIDETEDMYTLFSGTVWTHSTTRYPILSAFASTDAAILSSAPAYIDTVSTQPVNHANDLTVAFKLCVDNGIQWACRDKSGEQWIQITGENVKVVRPCSELYVIVNSTLGNESRYVYMRPRPEENLAPGTFRTYDMITGSYDFVWGFCFDSYEELDKDARKVNASLGWIGDGDYTYKVERWLIDEVHNDTTILDTMLMDATTAMYDHWFDTCKVPTNVAGHYLIRSFVHDNGCVTDWKENKPGFEYVVYGEFTPGTIVTKTDTFLLPSTSPKTIYINADSETPSVGGAPPVTYQWIVNGDSIHMPLALEEDLRNYPIDKAGTYVFHRGTRDSICYVPSTSWDALGRYTAHVFDAFDPGAITGELYQTFCTVEEARAFQVTTDPATGGVKDKGYHYQWYRVNGQDTTAIIGATSQNLNLSSYLFVPGGLYMFVRKAEDNTRFTKLTVSRNTLIIAIMQELKPGAIENEDRGVYCAEHDAAGDMTIPVVINEVTAASGESSIEYRWGIVDGNDTIFIGSQNQATFNYTLRLNNVLGKTYTFIRQARNEGCAWKTSAGQVTQTYGKKSYKEIYTTTCELPFVLTLADTTFTFKHVTDVFETVDNSGLCPAVTAYKVQLATQPDFTMGSSVSWCQTTGTLAIHFNDYSAVLSNTFKITYSDDLAAFLGKKDTVGIITTPGMITYENLPNLGEGDLYMDVQLGYKSDAAEGVCYSEAKHMRLYPSIGGYVYSKYDRVVFVDNNPNNGALPEVTEKMEFVAYQWYKNDILQEGQTGQYYHEGGAILNGYFYAIITDTKGHTYRTCDIVLPAETGSNPAPQRTHVYPIPVSGGEPLTIEGFGGSAQIISLAGERVATVKLNETTTVIEAPRLSGIYFVQIFTEDGGFDIHKLIVK